jgi:hypothetical protein
MKNPTLWGGTGFCAATLQELKNVNLIWIVPHHVLMPKSSLSKEM